MFPLELYRWLHVVSLLLVFIGLLGLVFLRTGGATSTKKQDRYLGHIHGIGLTLMLIAGFGAMARLGYMTAWPWWIYVKLVLWLYLGASAALAKRKAHLAPALLASWVVIAGLGAYLGIFKPLSY